MSTAARIREYIAFRYPNWLDYATYQARRNGFEGWEGDLLNDVIINLLEKDETMLEGMLNATTRKIVNNKPTTELDKFVLRMLLLNATSATAPFRKNTLGNKIISRADKKIQTIEKQEANLTIIDRPDEQYDEVLDKTIETMHHRNIKRLKRNGFTSSAIGYYHAHFVEGKKIEDFHEMDQLRIMQIKEFLKRPKTIFE